MNDPRKLIDESSGFELELLRAARDDAPSAGAPRRAAIALGVVAGPAIASTATAAGGAAGASKVGWFAANAMAVKAFAVVVVTGTASVALVHVSAPDLLSLGPAAPASASSVRAAARLAVGSSTDGRASSEPVIASPPAVAPDTAPWPPGSSMPPSLAPSISTPRAAPEASVDPARVESRPAPRVPGAVNAAAAAVQDAPSPKASGHAVSDEIAFLDLARRALGRGDPAEALRLLDAHDRYFGDGAFAVESSVLRIDTLEALGQRTAAFDLGERVLEAHPDEPVSRHVRSVVERLRGARANP
jgi:hypothetical protein